MLPTAVVYAPGLVVNEAVGAVVSTVIVRVDATPSAKLFAASLIAEELSCTEPAVPLVQFATVNV